MNGRNNPSPDRGLEEAARRPVPADEGGAVPMPAEVKVLGGLAEGRAERDGH